METSIPNVYQATPSCRKCSKTVTLVFGLLLASSSSKFSESLSTKVNLTVWGCLVSCLAGCPRMMSLKKFAANARMLSQSSRPVEKVLTLFFMPSQVIITYRALCQKSYSSVDLLICWIMQTSDSDDILYWHIWPVKFQGGETFAKQIFWHTRCAVCRAGFAEVCDASPSRSLKPVSKRAMVLLSNTDPDPALRSTLCCDSTAGA